MQHRNAPDCPPTNPPTKTGTARHQHGRPHQSPRTVPEGACIPHVFPLCLGVLLKIPDSPLCDPPPPPPPPPQTAGAPKNINPHVVHPCKSSELKGTSIHHRFWVPKEYWRGQEPCCRAPPFFWFRLGDLAKPSYQTVLERVAKPLSQIQRILLSSSIPNHAPSAVGLTTDCRLCVAGDGHPMAVVGQTRVGTAPHLGISQRSH